MEDLDEFLKAKNDRMAMCLDFTTASNAPSWTLPGQPTLKLLYIFAAIYLTAVGGAMLIPSCFSSIRPPVS